MQRLRLNRLMLHFCYGCLFAILSLSAQANSQQTIKVGLLNEATIADNAGGHFELVNQFVWQFWQNWAIQNQQAIEFIYLSGEEAFPALAAKTIDVVGLTTITGDDPNNLYSIPYARFTQRIFKHLKENQHSGIQLAIHSPRKSTLDFLGDYVQRSYFTDLDDMLQQHKNFDALYSVRPWVLEAKLKQQKLINQFYINTNEAPEIYFHFATRSEDRALLYQINETLRQIDLNNIELWPQQFNTMHSANFEFVLGNYLTNLSETEKQFVIDHNIITFPTLFSGFPPYIINKSFINIDERGLTIDILKQATSRTGLIFENIYVNDIAEGKRVVDNHQADFWAITNKVHPIRHWHYSKSYFSSNINVVHRINDQHYQHSKNLAGTTIAAVKDFHLTRYLTKQFPSATIKQFNSVPDAITAVANGDAQVFLGEALNNAYIIKHLKFANLISSPLNGLAFNAELAFAAPAQNASLITLLNRVINSISMTEFDNMYAAWSKTAFKSVEAKQEVRDAYQKATIVLGVVILTTIFITRFYIRQINFRKASQLEVEKALAEAQAAKQEAEQSAQAKINFLARMSHEIRTPMNGILGMAESLTFTQLTEEQKNYLSTLTDSADNLLVLLNDILDFAKIDAGKLTLEAQAVNIQELAELALKTVSHIKKEKELSLNVTLDEKLHSRYVTDPFRLTQVLNNLMSNAVKFTEQGSIELSMTLVSREAINNDTIDNIKISVKDTGIGIAQEQQKILFTPFTQADSAVTRKYGGTGLGLSICQEIITAMGSKIALNSFPNLGSEFYFTLKLAQAPIATLAHERRKKPRKATTNHHDSFRQLKVLMAEDNLVNIAVLSQQLKRLNINADVAENGQQALEMYHQKHHDIVISDCHMPILDGYELANILSQQKQDQRPWLIAITADALAGTAEKCLAAGFDDYVAKPCTQETVNNKMYHALRQLNNEAVQSLINPITGYTIFKPEAFLDEKQFDITTCTQQIEHFITTWAENKNTLFNITLSKDFQQIYDVVHRLAQSFHPFTDSSIDSLALLIEKQAQSLQGDAIEYTVKLLIKALETLDTEAQHWLTTQSLD